MPSRQDGVENRDKVYSKVNSNIEGIAFLPDLFQYNFPGKKLELLPHTQLSKQTAARKQDYEEIQSILEQQKAVGVIHLGPVVQRPISA